MCMLGVSSGLCCFVVRIAFFFFQAEDGIRDLVRSRGLGDVYKRQDQNGLVRMVNGIMSSRRKKIIGDQYKGRGLFEEAVSYTHLTLPTIYSV